ncbi:MAG: type II secretion system protein GspL [Burkholderiales bacterium]
MRILRLFINNNLNDLVNWVLVSDTGLDSGTSTFDELAQFEEAQLEVYLNANCCTIFKANIAGISNKRLTEELVLGIIEENLTDDIDEVKPIVLRVEDELAYIAIFNRQFYEELLNQLTSLNKPIRFLQSFVYATVYNEDDWTVFLSDEQSFVRTSKYEYYLFDDTKPTPQLLQDMLAETKPNSIMLYADSSYASQELEQFGVTINRLNEEFEFGEVTWNFYNQKSTKFKIKLDDNTKQNLLSLLKTIKYFSLFAAGFWLLNVIGLTINNYRLGSQLKSELGNLVAVTKINLGTVQTAAEKITNMRHARGIYDEKDAVPMFNTFLEVVSSIDPNQITQINYSNGSLQVFLTNGFATSQLASYKNILQTKRIELNIEDYKTYLKANQDNQQAVEENSEELLQTQQAQLSDNTAWVITLTPSLLRIAKPEVK